MMPSHSAPALNPTQPTRILVADRYRMASQLLAESLARDSRFEIVAVATPAEVLPIVKTAQLQVVLISADLDGAPRKGLQVARSLTSLHPSVHIVILLETGTRESVIAAFRCGATGVFCRTDALSDLPTCIERVSRGEIWSTRSHSRFLLEALRSIPSCEGIEVDKMNLLSHREFQVAECAAQGQSNKQIADRLGLSEHTVKNYLFRIFDKLGVSNRFELLFLLFKECNAQMRDRVALPLGAEIGHPIDTYVKAAEQGSVAAQFVVGLAHLEGHCIEKDDRSAYYWLRLAAENSLEVQHRSAGLIEELKLRITRADQDELERSVRSTIRDNQTIIAKRPQEIIKGNEAPTIKVAV
jgi:two-component system, NarL family, nitrate/nitrite response regulator NarL